MSGNSTRSARPRKPADRPKKPYPNYPLSPHASGKWQKKIRGRIYYFGNWSKVVGGKRERVPGDGWKEALDLYKAQADDLHAGRTPRIRKDDELTIKDLCNQFLTSRLRKQTAGEMGSRMFQEYREVCELIAAAFGKDRLIDDLSASDFGTLRATMAERWGPVRLGNVITRVKTVFKWGIDNGIILKPMRYGSEFCKPGKAILRKHRAQNGHRMLEAGQLRKVIDAAPQPMKAMILLGLNAGYGNNDVASLPLSVIDLERGWIDYPRPKTGVSRRCPLWGETATAIREALNQRPKPREADADIAFLQPSGRRWVRNTETSRTDNVSVQFGELLKEQGLHRAGLNFYALRHVFRTVADAARDAVAIDLIMGHSDSSMGAAYRERIDDARLKAVADHVRQWLFPAKKGGGK
jgi:integrase